MVKLSIINLVNTDRKIYSKKSLEIRRGCFIIKIWLILLNINEADSSSKVTKGIESAKKRHFLRFFMATIGLSLVVSSLPFSVEAGFFSKIFSNGKDLSVENISINSQNMNLLQAYPESIQNSFGGGNLIIEGNVIIPEIGALDSSGGLINIGRISTYVVKEADTISQIAEMFNVSVNTIRWGNDIGRNDIIQPGQVLVILPISGISHTIESGDTPENLAKKYKGDVSDILIYNNLNEDAKLVVGENIVIPGGTIETKAPVTSIISSSSSQGSSTAGVSSASSSGGYFIRPIVGGTRTQGIHGYNAIDLAAPEGTPIRASASGEVVVSRNSGWNGGYGNYIVISHGNGTQTLYSHNSRNVVSVGQWVSQGETIGYVGSTGNSTGPHVHFEVRGGVNPF